MEAKKCDYNDLKLYKEDEKFQLDIWNGFNLLCPDASSLPNKTIIL
jgi:hypothetical protein